MGRTFGDGLVALPTTIFGAKKTFFSAKNLLFGGWIVRVS